MSRGRALLLVTFPAGEADPAALEEFLRVGVGLAAGGHALEALALHELGPLTPTAETYLEALAEEGVSFSPPNPAGSGLREALLRSDNLMRLAAAGRSAVPELLLLDDTRLSATSDEKLQADLRNAGQVVRVG